MAVAGNQSEPGIMPLSVKVCETHQKVESETMVSVQEVFSQVRTQKTKKFSIKMSIMEIYEEKMYDIHSPHSIS